MNKLKFVSAAVLILILTAGNMAARTDGGKELKQAVKLYERGMFDHARAVLERVPEPDRDVDIQGYMLLCAINMKADGYENMLEHYIGDFPYSGYIPQMRFLYALNLFDEDRYAKASEQFEQLSRHQLYRRQVPEFLFKKAYCDFENGNMDRALIRFEEMENDRHSDYTAPARYAAAYINYTDKNFAEAISWFEKSAKDGRFAELSEYFLVECHFMLKNYDYVIKHGPEQIEKASADRFAKLARMVSESYLVLGDADKARHYYDLNAGRNSPKNRSDYFYAGSVLYAVRDYQGAIDNFSMMTDRTDSLGQIANYHLGYSYIQTKNKVAAMDAFQAASMFSFDPDIAEDAYFNYAKLAFDLNDDYSVFNSYLKRYPDIEKGDKIYSYMAVAALHGRDYAAAVAAYDQIDELDPDMKSNYMKANYLRAYQLVERGSYRDAIPYLKAAAYYSDRRGMFNQLSRFWLAESYYRNKQYGEALDMYTELYNISALYGLPESYLIVYGIAYCHFKTGDYPNAVKWFDAYLDGASVKYRKEAMLRIADCQFTQGDYRAAAKAYDAVLADYFNVNDIYPYYQAAMSYGLENDNNRKIALLSNVDKASPSAPFYSEALFELGRSYERKEDNESAKDCFNRLIASVKDSTFIARSYIELGTIAMNQSDSKKALEYYKTVVEKLGMTGYADDALLAIESLYQTQNNPEEYLAYIESIGKSSLKTDDEKEMMIFNAAEQIFLSENYEKALVSLKSYIEKYPQGAKLQQACFYIAEAYKNLNQKEQACDYYMKVMNSGEGAFAELSTLNYANISYSLERYEDAYRGYSSLSRIAVLENNKFAAVTGMMRSAYRWRNFQEAEKYAGQVIGDNRADADLKREAKYILAKSYLATSRRNEAFAVLEELSANPSFPEGAEAAYLIITDKYDRGDFANVENLVYEFADSGTSQQYWLAKAFIVLGDSFVERGEFEQAQATYESILTGYTPSGDRDDVTENVQLRLEKLKVLVSASASADSISSASN